MSIPRTALCIAYAAIALLALIGTWANNFQYLSLGFVGANLRFWQETFANPASRSITADLLFLTVAVAIWMLLEARRLAIRWVWLYIVFGALVAISVTVPLFLIQRERALAARGGEAVAGTLAARDVAGLGLLGAVATAYAAATLLF